MVFFHLQLPRNNGFANVRFLIFFKSFFKPNSIRISTYDLCHSFGRLFVQLGGLLANYDSFSKCSENSLKRPGTVRVKDLFEIILTATSENGLEGRQANLV